MKIYTDFSAYSDIAIGSARLFGIPIPENFDWPYLQTNIAQFWRHWHISLTSWLMD
jgi:alginate O-acetyltransferase complex protein AlgI